MKKIGIILFIITAGLGLNAQSGGTGFVISYFGGYGYYPGAKMGVEKEISSKILRKKKKNSSKQSRRQQLATLQLGGYYQSQNNLHLSLQAEWGIRRIRQNGWKTEVFAGMGAMRAFHLVPTYEWVEGAQEPESVALAGRWGFIPSVGIGIGKESENLPIAWHIRLHSMFQIPYNHTFLPHPMLEAGIVYYLPRLNKKSE